MSKIKSEFKTFVPQRILYGIILGCLLGSLFMLSRIIQLNSEPKISPKINPYVSIQKNDNPLRIGIITFYKQGKLNENGFSKNKLFGIIPHALKNMFIYSKLHGYSFYFLNDELVESTKDAYWGKIRILSYYMDKFPNKFDWFFYTDIDFLFTDLYTPFENTSWGNKLYNNSIHLIGVTECRTKTNHWKVMSGNFIIRNNKLMQYFLAQWYNGHNAFANTVNPEQTWFESMFYIPTKKKGVPNPRLIIYEKDVAFQDINYEQQKYGQNIVNPYSNAVILNDNLIHYYKDILGYKKWLDVIHIVYESSEFMTYTVCFRETKVECTPDWINWLNNSNVFGIHFANGWKPRMPEMDKCLHEMYPEILNHEIQLNVERAN